MAKRKKKKKIEPLGDLILEWEVVTDKMIDQHGLQWGDLKGILHKHLQVHRGDAQETYEDGTHPVDYYGPTEGLK